MRGRTFMLSSLPRPRSGLPSAVPLPTPHPRHHHPRPSKKKVQRWGLSGVAAGKCPSSDWTSSQADIVLETGDHGGRAALSSRVFQRTRRTQAREQTCGSRAREIMGRRSLPRTGNRIDKGPITSSSIIQAFERHRLSFTTGLSRDLASACRSQVCKRGRQRAGSDRT